MGLFTKREFSLKTWTKEERGILLQCLNALAHNLAGDPNRVNSIAKASLHVNMGSIDKNDLFYIQKALFAVLAAMKKGAERFGSETETSVEKTEESLRVLQRKISEFSPVGP